MFKDMISINEAAAQKAAVKPSEIKTLDSGSKSHGSYPQIILSGGKATDEKASENTENLAVAKEIPLSLHV